MDIEIMSPDSVGLDRSVQAVSQREIRSQPAVEPKSIAVEVTSVSDQPDFITRFRAHHRNSRLQRVRSLKEERKIHSNNWHALLGVHLTVDQCKKRNKSLELPTAVPQKPPRYTPRPKMPIPKKRTSITSSSFESDNNENIYETISGITRKTHTYLIRYLSSPHWSNYVRFTILLNPT